MTPAGSPLDVLREALHVLYAYTSDAANPPGRGRSETHAEGRAALFVVEQLVEAARDKDLFRLSNSGEAARETLRAALARFDGTLSQSSEPGSSAAGHHEPVGERQGRQPDSEEIAALLVELARWSRVAERNGDLHARVASALARFAGDRNPPA